MCGAFLLSSVQGASEGMKPIIKRLDGCSTKIDYEELRAVDISRIAGGVGDVEHDILFNLPY